MARSRDTCPHCGKDDVAIRGRFLARHKVPIKGGPGGRRWKGGKRPPVASRKRPYCTGSGTLAPTFYPPLKRLPPPPRDRLDADRKGWTKVFRFGDEQMYVTANAYPDGRLAELFLTIAKEGSLSAGLAQGLAVSVSLGLQHGVPLAAYTKQFRHMRFAPSGPTGDREKPTALSFLDYLAWWLDERFGKPTKETDG